MERRLSFYDSPDKGFISVLGTALEFRFGRSTMRAIQSPYGSAFRVCSQFLVWAMSTAGPWLCSCQILPAWESFPQCAAVLPAILCIFLLKTMPSHLLPCAFPSLLPRSVPLTTSGTSPMPLAPRRGSTEDGFARKVETGTGSPIDGSVAIFVIREGRGTRTHRLLVLFLSLPLTHPLHPSKHPSRVTLKSKFL